LESTLKSKTKRLKIIRKGKYYNIVEHEIV